MSWPCIRDTAILIWTTLPEVTRAFLRCWYLFLFGLPLAALFAYVPQLRESMLFPELFFFILYFLAALLAACLAMMLVDTSSADPTKRTAPIQYASHLVPGFIALSFIASFPSSLSEQLEGVVLSERLRNRVAGFQVFFALAAIFVPLVRLLPFLDKKRMGTDPGGQKAAIATSAYIVVTGIAFVVLKSFTWIFGCVLITLVITDIWTWPPGVSRYARQTIMGGVGLLSFCMSLFTIWIIASPVGRSSAVGIGPMEAILLAAILWLTIGMVATMLFRRIGIFPATMLSGVIGWLFLCGPFNLETVRTFPYKQVRIAPRRPELREYISNWLDARLTSLPNDRKLPVFLVTADGGGIRAAFWTAITLGALQDANASFAHHTLGISSVSGGSLGAVVYAGLVKEQSSGRIEFEFEPPHFRGPIETHSSRVLAHDFLSPPLLSMLVPDVWRTIVRTSFYPNRGASLETAFEHAWQTEVGTDSLSKPFQQIWVGQSSHVPALFLNGTRPDTGERLVLSHVSLENSSIEAIDIQSYLGQREVRASTAVMMSARFPGISPTGRIVSEAKQPPFLDIVDGGYFDNTGSATAADLLRELLSVAEEKGLRDRIVPVLLVIPNSPQPRDLRPEMDPAQQGAVRRDPIQDMPTDGGLLGALGAPIGTLDSIRAGVGKRFRVELTSAVTDAGGVLLEFPLLKDEVDFPLGWMLSNETCEAMHQQVAVWKGDNQSDFAKAIQLLKGPPPNPPE